MFAFCIGHAELLQGTIRGQIGILSPAFLFLPLENKQGCPNLQACYQNYNKPSVT